ncbi:MAG: 2-oxo acid dehydrogenase subunit E2, partial [Alphaproteobacteria bacterium]
RAEGGFPEPSAPHELVPLDTMRKTIAKRLGEAKREIPHFYLTVDIELDALLRLRAELNGRADADYKLSVNDFVIKACAIALKRVPAANAIFGGDRIYRLTDVDVAVAVALEGGLITPVLRRVDGKGLATISNEMKDLASRARAGKLMPEEYQGGAFCISNLGMYGIKDFAAIINPPQSGILAVGAGEPRPVVKDGALAIATVMTTTLSVDHRVVDGAVGADVMKHVKALLEDPMALLL